jgi:hypothetical protein
MADMRVSHISGYVRVEFREYAPKIGIKAGYDGVFITGCSCNVRIAFALHH